MSASLESKLTQLVLDQSLAVLIRKEHGAAALACEPVTLADLTDVVSEAWRDGCLRAGYPAVSLSETPMRLTPVFVDESDSRCAGFKLELNLPSGQTAQRVFTVHCLRHVADRAVEPLIEAGVLTLGQSYLFEVVIDSRGTAVSGPTAGNVPLTVSLRSAPLSHLTVSLRSLLERSKPVALLDEEAFPVFYTEEAFNKAEDCARRGGQANPPVETGGVLFGSLAACAESGEFCTIVNDVIEVQDAEEKNFSLSYSSRSWLRLQAIQKARQAAYPQRAERLVGQCHGHPFLPHDGKRCAECEKRATCLLTSAFVSLDDQTWHRAVFARQPWALCHIFGLSARGEAVNQLYALKDGRLQARGFYLLPDFPLD